MCNFVIFFAKYGRFVIFEGIGPISFLHVPEKFLLGASLARPRGSISLHGNQFTSSHCTGSKLAYPGFLHLLLLRSELLQEYSLFGWVVHFRQKVSMSNECSTPLFARLAWCKFSPSFQFMNTGRGDGVCGVYWYQSSSICRLFGLSVTIGRWTPSL